LSKIESTIFAFPARPTFTSSSTTALPSAPNRVVISLISLGIRSRLNTPRTSMRYTNSLFALLSRTWLKSTMLCCTSTISASQISGFVGAGGRPPRPRRTMV
jgi:hypothetical protein